MALLHVYDTRLQAAAMLIAVLGAAGCESRPAAFSQHIESLRLASDLRVQFTRAADSSNRAVMADTDEASTAAAEQARSARQAVERNVGVLQTTLQSLGYDDIRLLDTFRTSFAEYRKLDDEILPLAVENSNLKAQRLSFGSAREAADAFRTSVDGAVKAAASKGGCCAQTLAAQANAAVLEIRVLHAQHIAELQDDAMTRMERQMAASEAAAREALTQLKAAAGSSAAPQLAEAAAALDRFKTVNDEIVRLSRRNTNVRSLALVLGRKSTVTAQCDEDLRALEEALAKHQFSATR